MSGANASPKGRSHQKMSGANASPKGRSHQKMTRFTNIPKQVEDVLEKWNGMTSRRDFLKTSGLFVVSLTLSPEANAQGAAAAQAAGPYRDPDFRQLDSWIVIHEDSTATFYVGKTDGHLGRPANHKEILKKYRVTQTWLFQVRSSRRLAAAECLAIHAYDPKENRRKAERPKYQTECEICKRIRKAWREFRPVVRSREN